VKKIKIYPDVQTKQIFKNWFDTGRYVWNKTIESVKNGEKINFFSLRNLLVIAKNNQNVKEWECKTPKDIRAGVVKDVVTAFKSCFSNLRKKNIQHFQVSYKNKKKKSNSLTISKSSIKIKNNKIFMYPQFLNKTEIKVGKRTQLPEKIKHDCQLHFDGKFYYLLIPVDFKTTNSQKNSICSIDPGVKNFLTIYDPSNFQIKTFNPSQKIQTIYTKVIKMQEHNKIHKTHKHFRKINNLITDMHWKSINFLTQNYKLIFLPKFESQEMVRKTKKLNKTIRHKLNTLSHWKFQEKLKFKCFEKNIKLEIVSEEFTSKTCGMCGVLNEKLKSSRTFKCDNCNLTIDRDINGARNIFIKSVCI